MILRNGLALVAVVAGLVLSLTAPVFAQGKKSDAVVKATASADKPDATGKQTVTITLTVDPKYHIYANPVGNEDFESNSTSVEVKGAAKLAKVDYPAGELVQDKVVGNYKVYKGKVTIKATLQRSNAADSVIKLAIKLQACSKTSCLLPATLMVDVP